MPHNYLFSSEVRYWFQYDPGAEAEFFFRGEPLDLDPGSVYEIAVFHAERNPVVFSYRLELSGFNTSPGECVPVLRRWRDWTRRRV